MIVIEVIEKTPPSSIPPSSLAFSSPLMSPAPTLHAAEFGGASLYVGDLDRRVWEKQLFWLFHRIAPVVSVKVCRDRIRGTSLGYAYVNFRTAQDASRAMAMLNFTPVNGKPLRIMWSQRDSSFRKNSRANVFIKNLESHIDSRSLYDTFALFGTILSCKVASDIDGKSKGHGFVQFEKEESAKFAIRRLNGMLLNGKKVYVGLFIRRQERNKANVPLKFTNVYIKNLPETFTDADLQREFRIFGDITSAIVAKDEIGRSRCFGFVNFQTPDAAATAVENLNGMILDDKVVYVGRAQKKAERRAELKAKYEKEREERLEKLKGRNLYLKNLAEDIDEALLKKIFSEFGDVISCKVLVDSQGRSKCFGFVAFTTAEVANRAIFEMNGRMIRGKQLYVSHAQSKEERRSRLMAHFSEIYTPESVAPASPMYHPVSSTIMPEQPYFRQAAPVPIPLQPSGYSSCQSIQGIFPGIFSNSKMPYSIQTQG